MLSTRCHLIARSLFNIQNTITSQTASPGGASKHRTIFISKTLRINYYEALGIPANSTQNDIKTAYYKLSMVYHPDKNQGSESAATKFREITQAYEVLSNYRLRRLYDKGIIHTAGAQYAKPDIREDTEDVEEDDPQTKFYKSRFSKSKVTSTRGQTPIYDFDEWTKAHYGTSFDRRKSAKERFDRKETRDRNNQISIRNEIIIFAAVLVFVGIYLIIHMERSYDTPRPKEKKN